MKSAQKNISTACVETLQSIIPPPPSRFRLHRRWLPDYPQSLAYSIIINKRELDCLLAVFIVMGLILFSSGILLFAHWMKGTEFATIPINMRYLILGRARSIRTRTVESKRELSFLELAPNKTHSDGNINHKSLELISTPRNNENPQPKSIADDYYLTTLVQTILPSKSEFGLVLYDYRAQTSVPGLDINVKAGDRVAILTKTDREGNSTGWWGCRTESGLYGYLPSRYLQCITRPQGLGSGDTQLKTSKKGRTWLSDHRSDKGPYDSTNVTGLRQRIKRTENLKDTIPSEDTDLIKPTVPVDRLSTAKLLLKMAARNGAANAAYHAAMMEAARQGYDSVVVFLGNVKPKARRAGTENAVPLWAVMKNDHETVLERLLDGEVETGAFTRGQFASIHISRENLGSSARPTVEAGVDVNITDDKGRTPLMLMAENGQFAAVELLIRKGASKHMLDSNQWSAIDFARYGGHMKVLGLLGSTG